MTKNFIVTVPVKPYIKRHIELNFGNPANFSKSQKIQSVVHACLSDPSTRYDKKFENKLCTYNERIKIEISQDYFYRYGWEFTKTDIVTFGKTFEYMIKQNMIIIVGSYIGVGYRIKDAIKEYQAFSGMEEQYWPFESIKKEYYRKKPDVPINFLSEIITQINKLIVVTLSPARDNITVKKLQHDNA